MTVPAPSATATAAITATGFQGKLRPGFADDARVVLLFDTFLILSYGRTGSESGQRAVERKARSRRLLPTTNTLENAIAAPASIGFSMPSAAIGIAATL